MAIQWGGFTNHIRVGIETSNDGYDTYTPSINVYVDVYIQIDSTWNFSDNQRVTLSGSGVSAAWDFNNNLGKNAVRYMGRATIGGQGQSYGGGPYYSFTAILSGNYLGADSRVDVGYTLPGRPYRPPSPPAWPPTARNITTNFAILDWGGSSDVGGLGVSSSGLQVATDPGFGGMVYASDGQAFYREIGGLQPATTYYARAYNVNGAGGSGWSATGSFATIGLNITSAPTFSQVSSVGAKINWAYPAAGTPTRYHVQVSRDSGFTQLSVDYTASWAQTVTVTNLAQRTGYWVRVRSGDASVWGPWSPVSSFTTSTGAFARVNGQWQASVPYAQVDGVWRPVSALKRVGGVWVG